MRNNINWDVCPDWVRFTDRNTGSGAFEDPEDTSADCSGKKKDRHVHEFSGSTKLAEQRDDKHNHRFAGVTGEAIPISFNNHRHKLCTKTDYFGHIHEIEEFTGPAVDVGDNKHVHFVDGETTVDDCHLHEFQFATLIESPLLPLDDHC